MKLQLF